LTLAALAAFASNGILAQSIFDVLQTNGNTNDFASLMQKSSSPMIANLSSGGNYTIFAPANSAFTPQVLTLIQLNSPSDISNLVSYHILNGTYHSSNFQSGTNIVDTFASNSSLLKWSNGSGLPLDVVKNSSDGLELFYGFGSSKVIQADISASNGVIHIIDMIMGYPQSPSATIASQNAPVQLTQFYGAIQRLGIANSLDNDNGVTIFAPNDDAFSGVNLTTMSNDTLNSIINYHIVSNVYYSTNLTNNANLTTQNGTNITVSKSGDSISVGNQNTTGKVILADVLTNNGVIHIIDHLLMPPNNTNSTNNTSSSTQGSGAGMSAEISRATIILSIVAIVCSLIL